MHWFAILTILIQLAVPLFSQPVARAAALQDPDSGLLIVNQEVRFEFGSRITFTVRVQSETSTVQEMIVFITPEGKPTVWEEITLDEDGTGTLQIDARRLSLSPFSIVNYRFEARLANDSSLSSETFWFEYTDNRFKWQSQDDGIFQVYWYSSELTLGQEILNIAQQGLQKAQTILQAQPPQPLRIYAYASSRDLQYALQMGSHSWIAGHANPELGMIMISIPSGPERKLELERQIPHEIAHLLQYQMIGDSFMNQPVWLIEGMASLAELYPNPEYRRVLESTAQVQDVIPFRELCTSFPREANGAFRAYAQSDSFVSYLHAKYGAEKLRKLILEYQDGLGCEEGFAVVYSATLDRMEQRWKQEVLGINTGQLAMQNLSPYLLLGLLIILPASLALLPLKNKAGKPE
jgi:hypothetical protein